jgi:hypothetical protein
MEMKRGEKKEGKKAYEEGKGGPVMYPKLGGT